MPLPFDPQDPSTYSQLGSSGASQGANPGTSPVQQAQQPAQLQGGGTGPREQLQKEFERSQAIAASPMRQAGEFAMGMLRKRFGVTDPHQAVAASAAALMQHDRETQAFKMSAMHAVLQTAGVLSNSMLTPEQAGQIAPYLSQFLTEADPTNKLDANFLKDFISNTGITQSLQGTYPGVTKNDHDQALLEYKRTKDFNKYNEVLKSRYALNAAQVNSDIEQHLPAAAAEIHSQLKMAPGALVPQAAMVNALPQLLQMHPEYGGMDPAQREPNVYLTHAKNYIMDPKNGPTLLGAGIQSLAEEGKQMVSPTPFTKQVAQKLTAAALKQNGWSPDMPGYQDAYDIVYGNASKVTPVQGVGAFGASQLTGLNVPPPPGKRGSMPGSQPGVPLVGPLDAPLGKDAELYINAKGENPPATMTGRDAQAQGYTPYKEAPKMFEAEQASRLFKQHLEIVKSYADLFPAETGSKIDDLAIAGAAAAKRYTTGQVDPRVTKLAAISLPASLQSIIATVPNARAGARLLSGFEELTNPYRVWTKESYLAAIDGLNSMAETALAQRGRPGMNQPANVPGAATVPPASLTQKSPAVKSVPAPAVVGPAGRPSSALTPTHVWNPKTKSLEPVK